MSEPAAPAADVDDVWRIEPALVTDRGLVARLVEAVAAADPSAAPEVADGSLRAAQWLQQLRPEWTGVAVLTGEASSGRRVVGYVAAVAGPETGWRVLVHPTLRGGSMEHELVLAARAALMTAATVEAPRVVDPQQPAAPLVTGPEPEPAPPARPWGERLVTTAGAVAIAIAGVAATLAVQIGTGTFDDLSPFLGPDTDRAPAAAAERGPASGAAPAARSVSGTVLTPTPPPTSPAPATGAPVDDGPGLPPGGAQPDGPGEPPVASPGVGTPRPEAPGLVSAVVDPLADGGLGVVDAVTRGATAPVTDGVREVVDAGTDAVDGLVAGLLDALATRSGPPTGGTGS
ncbi:hypothetical protein [Nocardioides sp. SYSU DS0663]|uniref:hypothetical protein n=1 Tax=Nocardioides sp. SYSU DS0663 TaxID=3416445 RepID=UPI003F4BFB43